MLIPRNLTDDEQKELNDWLTFKKLDLNHRARRDLSNVVNMALLFKDVNNKLVNMNNYTSHGNLKMKLLNWDTFNLNVLKKTGLFLKRAALEQLAMGELNAIRFLLFHLMRLERDGGVPIKSRRISPVKREKPPNIIGKDDETREDPPQSAPMQDAPIPTEPHNQMQMQKLAMSLANEQISRDLKKAKANYEELKYINDNKEKIICALSQKVLYLEKTIVEKETRINDLLDHLSTLSVRIISMQTTLTDDDLPRPPQPAL